MLYTDAQLNPNLFEENVEKVPIRNGFSDGLVLAGEQDERVVGVCADLADSVKMGAFAKKFPTRYVEMGITEQNMASVASGMAAMGRVPFAASYAMFSPGRNWEQIRTTICYNDRHVKLVGGHAGLSTGPDGGTHQALEDIALARVLPRMNVVVPCDAIEAKKATLAMAQNPGVFYLRLAREKSPVLTTEATPFQVGKAQIMWDATDPHVAIFACGLMVHEALKAAKKLEEQGVWAVVVNVHTVKPLDVDTVVAVARRAKGRVVTVEEHQIIGGLGGAIAETLSERYPSRIAYIGVGDRFGQSGEGAELLQRYGLTAERIFGAAQRVIGQAGM